ncbi:MAG TPA: hypothetical protein VKI65_13030 [Gemmataceae bacterium]|nr:hypothetical protein [Gemmataceae bacterium]
MIRALVWKEYREHRAIWLAIAAIAICLGYGLAAGYGLTAPIISDGSGSRDLPPDPTWLETWTAFPLIVSGLMLATVYGLVCGAMMLAGEREANTQAFLDILTARRAGLWFGKLLIGLALTCLQGLLLGAVAFSLGLESQSFSTWNWFWIVPVVALEAYAWGLFASALCRTTLAAVGLGLVPLGAIWLVWPPTAWPPAVMVLVIRGALLVTALALSGLVYCEQDRARLPVRLWVRQQLRRRSPILDSVRRVHWLIDRQTRLAGLVLVAASVLVGFLMPWLANWPMITLFIGVACGTMVFGSEQLSSAARFLGDQRLPPGRIWLVKTTFCLLLATLCGLLAYLSTVLYVALAGVRQRAESADATGGILRLLVSEWETAPLRMGTVAFLATWLVIGFSIAQLFALVVKKTAVALLLALFISIGVSALWVPSVVGGGLTLWLVLPGPVLLLACSRFLMWSWFGDRLFTVRPVAALIGWCALAALATLAGFAYRAVEVPSAGEPFDVRAFQNPVQTPERKELVQRLRAAVRELRQDEGDGPAVRLFLDRVSQLQANGDHQAALDRLTTALALARNLDNRFTADFEHQRMHAERAVVDGFDQWLNRLGRRPELARQALEAIQQHEADRLALSDIIRTRYLGLRNTLDDPRHVAGLLLRGSVSLQDGWGVLIPAAVQAPWEQARRKRIVRAVFAGSLRALEAGYPEVQAAERLGTPAGDPLDIWVPARQGPEASLTYPRLARLVEESALKSVLPEWRKLYLAELTTLGRIRAMRLKLALVLFEAGKGKLPVSLNELLPDYVPTLPLDPFSEQPFHYRISRGERLRPKLPLFQPRPWRAEPPVGQPEENIPAGQAVLWSVGPDGIDHGGTRQGDDEKMDDVAAWSAGEMDWIFLVPRLAPK